MSDSIGEEGKKTVLNPDEKAELTQLMRQAQQNIQTDNYRDFESIASRLLGLLERWRSETVSSGTHQVPSRLFPVSEPDKELTPTNDKELTPTNSQKPEEQGEGTI